MSWLRSSFQPSAPGFIFTPLKELSKFLIVMAMSAIGLKTNLVAMVKSSGKSILLGA
ncbi:putative sulfate exporter family transporter, partial [Streptococcus pneumoniae]